jgi:hypothetical protein
MVFMSQPVPIPRDIVDPREKGNEGLSRREMHVCALEGSSDPEFLPPVSLRQSTLSYRHAHTSTPYPQPFTGSRSRRT